MFSTLSWFYGKIINKRNSQYKKGNFKSYSLGAPTISIGNITVGGTGKTPLVIYIAHLLAEKGENVCVISRGYKRENEKERILVSNKDKVLSNVKKAGDEPFEMAKKLLGKAIVIADANRVEAGKWAQEEFGITAFVLDDAFQHLKAKRNVDIVVIDATNPFGNKRTLPSGILREPLENLKRSDVVIITRANLVKNIEALKTEIKILCPDSKIFVSQNKTFKISKLEDFLAFKNDVERRITKQPALAFCALGNPNNFFTQLNTEGFNLICTKTFRDHHFYTQKDIKELEIQAGINNCETLLTTVKDAVKLQNLEFKLPLQVVESKIFFKDKKKLHEIIHTVFDNKK